jgi:hypothetical protein
MALAPSGSNAATLRVVITEPHVVSRDPRLAVNQTVRIRRDQITHHEGEECVAPILELRLVDGQVEGYRRVDGRTEPLKLRVVECQSSALWGGHESTVTRETVLVDHTGEVHEESRFLIDALKR